MVCLAWIVMDGNGWYVVVRLYVREYVCWMEGFMLHALFALPLYRSLLDLYSLFVASEARPSTIPTPFRYARDRPARLQRNR